MRQFHIKDYVLTEKDPAFVIAEIGHNHGGDVRTALKMIDEAVYAGADCVKFQRIDAKRLFTQAAYNEPYNSENAFAPLYGQHRDALTLSDDDFKRIKAWCDEQDIVFACTAFEEWSADFLMGLDVDAFKLASFHHQDDHLIRHIKAFNKPIIASVGHSLTRDWAHLKWQLEGSNYAILHCTSEYPVRNPEHLNLGTIPQLRNIFNNTIVGYSHHYEAPFLAAHAYAYGARIVEVHFTLSRSAKGTDNAFSLQPDGLHWLCSSLQDAFNAQGRRSGIYTEEIAPIRKMSRSCYTNKPMKQGYRISGDDICLKAPGGGLPSKSIHKLIGKKVKFDIDAETPLNWDNVYE